MTTRIAPIVGAVAVVVVSTLLAVWSSDRPAQGAVAAARAPGQPEGTGQTDVSGRSESTEGDPVRGRELFQRGCASCHGADGQGVEDRGPDLSEAGAASADFYLSTGRMPMDEPSRQTRRKRPAYDAADRADLVAFVAQLGDGPAIPDVDVHEGDLAEGQEIYTDQCAACHSSAGAGGAVGQNVFAPGVTSATELEIAEAVRVGPGAMPAFGERALDDEQLASVIRYVEFLRSPDDRGGAPLGRIGPVPEGLVAWLVGIGSLVLFMRWIGDRS